MSSLFSNLGIALNPVNGLFGAATGALTNNNSGAVPNGNTTMNVNPTLYNSYGNTLLGSFLPQLTSSTGQPDIWGNAQQALNLGQSEGNSLPGQIAAALGLGSTGNMTTLGQLGSALGFLPQLNTGTTLPSINPQSLLSSIPQASNLQSPALGAAQGFLSQLNFNPTSAAQDIVNQMNTLLGPQQQTQRNQLQEQLLAQGRLGSTGGGVQQKALEDSIAGQNASVAANALGQAQSYQSMLGQQANSFLNTGLTANNQAYGQQTGINSILQNLAGNLFTQNNTNNQTLLSALGIGGNLASSQAGNLQSLLGTGLTSSNNLMNTLLSGYLGSVNGSNNLQNIQLQYSDGSGGSSFLNSALSGIVQGGANKLGSAGATALLAAL